MPARRLPLLQKRTAWVLGSAALAMLAFPRACAARQQCQVDRVVELSDGEGVEFKVVYRRCQRQHQRYTQIDICDDALCVPDTCGPLATRRSGAWAQPPLAVPLASGAQDVLIVRRPGPGGQLSISHYFVRGGWPRCVRGMDVEGVFGDRVRLEPIAPQTGDT